jgi:signal transduction histidine kinase
MRAATRSPGVTADGLSPAYQFELNKLLLTTAAITEVVAVDERGIVRGRASRLRTVLPEGLRDFSTLPAFQQAKRGESHFGPIYYVRPSEPFMTMAVPIEHFSGQVIGVLQAEVSVIYIGEHVVSPITVGETGYAYVVNRSGELIAHPQVAMVLQRRQVADPHQVQEVLRLAAAGVGSLGTLTRNIQGEKVFRSYAVIPNVDWVVFIERPAAEAYRPLYASIVRASALLLLGLGLALAAIVFVARRILRPIEALRGGVERIGKGDLGFRLQIRTGDEIEALADEFNRMTATLQEAHTGLEQKVTERTQELMTLNQELDAANRLKSQFLANVSHELRTPLNAIIGFTRLVIRKTEGQIPPLQHTNLQKVLISAEQLLGLINGLLDLSKIEAGKMEVYPTRFDVTNVLNVAVSTIEPMLKAGRVRLLQEVEPDLPTLDTDREKLQQIVVNLLSNAAKFTEAGVIIVSARCDDGWLRLSVSDTGIGIPKEALQYIFEEFRQVDMTSTRAYAGTGLGLAIVRRLVSLLGGDIVAESELGKGSTFTLRLPVTLEPSRSTAAF